MITKTLIAVTASLRNQGNQGNQGKQGKRSRSLSLQSGTSQMGASGFQAEFP